MRWQTRFETDICPPDELPQRWPRVFPLLKAHTGKSFPGAVFGAWSLRRPDFFSGGHYGQAKWDTFFDISSLTKIFATTTLAARLIERGWLDWDTKVSSYFPLFKGHADCTVAHLLSHTAGYSAYRCIWLHLQNVFSGRELSGVPVKDRQLKARELILNTAPTHGLGARVIYSDISFLMLGFLLEEMTQLPLDEAVDRWVMKPLGLNGPHFVRVRKGEKPRFPTARYAPTEISEWRGGLLQGQVHDDNCWAMGGYAGHSGLFCSITDLFWFLRALSQGFVSTETLQRLWSPWGSFPRTLGWDIGGGEGSSTGTAFSKRTVGHLGFTGTSLWLDLEREAAVVLLTNRVHPSRDNVGIREARPLLHSALLDDFLRR